MTAVGIILDVLLVGVALAGALTDVFQHRIHDWITYPALGVGLLLHAFAFGFGGVFDSGLVSSLFGAGFCTVVFGAFWLWKRGFGAGDVKLMAALGALAGFVLTLTMAMATAIVGALMALGRVLMGPELRAWVRHKLGRRSPSPRREGSMTIPYGVAIAVGVLWAIGSKHGLVPGL